MRIEAGKEEVIKYSYICDICGNETSHHRICSICSRDICSDCTKFDPRDTGDYPEKYCDSCFNIGKKYLDQISIEEEKYDVIIENLEQEWRDEAIKAVKGDKK
jgi:hypothetical protein